MQYKPIDMNTNIIRQIVLDTETTGMNKYGKHYEGHKIVEIGAVEIINRCLTDKQFHVYLNPNRSVDPEAFRIHGISDQFLMNQPTFLDIANELFQFIQGAELIIHNAFFDLGFLNYEFKICNKNLQKIEFYCKIIDSLKIARKKFPGQRNSLDALCERYRINRNSRVLHNALIDAQLLSHVFLSMTGEQTKIKFTEMSHVNTCNINQINLKLSGKIKSLSSISLKVIYANNTERLDHVSFLNFIKKVNKCCIWEQYDE